MRVVRLELRQQAGQQPALVSTFSALWPPALLPKAGHLGRGEPAHHRLQVRDHFLFSFSVNHQCSAVRPVSTRSEISSVTQESENSRVCDTTAAHCPGFQILSSTLQRFFQYTILQCRLFMVLSSENYDYDATLRS